MSNIVALDTVKPLWDQDGIRLFKFTDRKDLITLFDEDIRWKDLSIYSEGFFRTYGNSLFGLSEISGLKTLFHLPSGKFAQSQSHQADEATASPDADLNALITRLPVLAQPLAAFIEPAIQAALMDTHHLSYKLPVVAQYLALSAKLGIWQDAISPKMVGDIFDATYDQFFYDNPKADNEKGPHALPALMESCQGINAREAVIIEKIKGACLAVPEKGVWGYSFSLLLREAKKYGPYSEAVSAGAITAAYVGDLKEYLCDGRGATLLMKAVKGNAAWEQAIPDFLVVQAFETARKNKRTAWQAYTGTLLIEASQNKNWQNAIPKGMVGELIANDIGIHPDITIGILAAAEENSGIKKEIENGLGKLLLTASMTARNDQAQMQSAVIDFAKCHGGTALTLVSSVYPEIFHYNIEDIFRNITSSSLGRAAKIRPLLQSAVGSERLQETVKQLLPGALTAAMAKNEIEILKMLMEESKKVGSWTTVVEKILPTLYRSGPSAFDKFLPSGRIDALLSAAKDFAPYAEVLAQIQNPPAISGLFKIADGRTHTYSGDRSETVSTSAIAPPEKPTIGARPSLLRWISHLTRS